MGQVITTMWNILNIQMSIQGFSFSLWNVVEAGIILSLIGLALSKIIFFINEKR